MTLGLRLPPALPLNLTTPPTPMCERTLGRHYALAYEPPADGGELEPPFKSLIPESGKGKLGLLDVG